MDLSSNLEIIMRNALSENHVFFVEQVYVRTETSFYIFDFVVYGDFCKVIVECDGPHHYNLEQWYLDSRRDLWSIQNGYQDILRFSAPQLANNIDSCIKKVENTILAYDLVLKKDKKMGEIIRSERQEILRRKSKKTDSNVSEYTGLKVIITDDELRHRNEVKFAKDLKSQKRNEIVLRDYHLQLKEIKLKIHRLQTKEKNWPQHDLKEKNKIIVEINRLRLDEKRLRDKISCLESKKIALEDQTGLSPWEKPICSKKEYEIPKEYSYVMEIEIWRKQLQQCKQSNILQTLIGTPRGDTQMNQIVFCERMLKTYDVNGYFTAEIVRRIKAIISNLVESLLKEEGGA